MKQLHILVVDDEPAIRQILASQLERSGHSVRTASDGRGAVDLLGKAEFDVCICDLRLPDIDGMEVIRRCRQREIDVAFLVITAFASVKTAIEAMKLGAYDYLMKPVQPEDVLLRLQHIADVTRLRDENSYLRKIVDAVGPGDHTLGVSPAMQEVQVLVDKVSRTDGTVLITGESGTGKSHVARVIHKRGPRRERPLVSVNCGAIPEQLLESELFGHLKGAFTGADRAKKGLFREADGGTLFLDEIGELPLSLQVKLLHAIEDKEIRPVGAETARRVDVRILAATNRNIEEMVRGGQFREDLYYRLNVLNIALPPLRQRRDDVPVFIRHFLGSEVERLGLEGAFRLDPDAEEHLLAYDWPGNLRELQNVIARALVLADEREIGLSDLPAQVTRGDRVETHDGFEQLGGTLREQVRQFENNVIQRALEAAGDDRMVAAKALGIGLSTLYRKLEER